MRDDHNGKLSPRETEILESIAAGLSNKDISQQLGITLCTVKDHVHNILTKLQVRRRQDHSLRAEKGTGVRFTVAVKELTDKQLV